MLLLHPPPFHAMHVHFGCQSLTTAQLRSSRGQPTARVCLCCFKGPHQGMLPDDHCICAKDLRMVSMDLKPPKDFIKRGSYPLHCLPFQCVAGDVTNCVVGKEEHPVRNSSSTKTPRNNCTLSCQCTSKCPPLSCLCQKRGGDTTAL